jgi:hypothetical protein
MRIAAAVIAYIAGESWSTKIPHALFALMYSAIELVDRVYKISSASGGTPQKKLYEALRLPRSDAGKSFEECGKPFYLIHRDSIPERISFI